MEVVGQHRCGSPGPTGLGPGDIEQSLVRHFAAQVDAHRACVAVRDPTCSLTYGELDRWANGIAHAVIDRCGTRSEPAVLLFRQGAASTAAILGVLASGRPYVSLDPGDPRSARAAAAVGAGIVVTTEDLRESAATAAPGLPVLVVDDVSEPERPDVETGPDDVAYVFFTSGTTGEPKGVYDSHRNVLHNVLRYTTTLGITPADRLSLLHSPSVSACVSSLFTALLNGAALLPFPFEGDLGVLARWVREERVSVYHSVPGIYRGMLQSRADTFSDVRIVRLEGDRASALDVELHRRHFGAGSVLVNGLGTTETGLVRQLFVAHDTAVDPGILPIGYPVRDMEVLVTDEHLGALPAGTSGEIAVQSRYLALGYWNRPDLTAERFGGEGDARTYRTGDLGRLRADGCLEFLGRLDGELKVLGNRVEPAEVEAELALVPGVQDAAVTTQAGRRGEGRLVAFVVPSSGREPTAGAIRDALRQRVPGYMVPSRVVLVDRLPLGANGKLDRTALTARSPDAAPPAEWSSDEERLVARIWASVLEVEKIGPDDEFLDLGGDSLAAAEIAAQLETETGVALDARAFLSAPTVASMADLLSAPRDQAELELRSEGPGALVVLCHGVYPGNTFLFTPLARRLAGHAVCEIHPRILETCSVDEVVERHLDALRGAAPTGPYVLVGHCSGAMVARELALRLLEAGATVELLVVLGISPTDFPELLEPGALERWNRGAGKVTVRERIRIRLAHARTLGAGEGARYLAGGARRAAERALGRPGSPDVGQGVRPYPGEVALVLAEETTSTYSTDPARDWRGLADLGVDALVLPGGDRDMMEAPLVDELAAHLLRRLGAGSEEGSAGEARPHPAV